MKTPVPCCGCRGGRCAPAVRARGPVRTAQLLHPEDAACAASRGRAPRPAVSRALTARRRKTPGAGCAQRRRIAAAVDEAMRLDQVPRWRVRARARRATSRGLKLERVDHDGRAGEGARLRDRAADRRAVALEARSRAQREPPAMAPEQDGASQDAHRCGPYALLVECVLDGASMPARRLRPYRSLAVACWNPRRVLVSAASAIRRCGYLELAGSSLLAAATRSEPTGSTSPVALEGAVAAFGVSTSREQAPAYRLRSREPSPVTVASGLRRSRVRCRSSATS